MDYKTKIEFQVDIVKRLRTELKILAPSALISILLIELWLNKIPAPTQFLYDLGVIYLKLCYSFVSAFIFFYLVVYSPKDRKKAKSFLIVSNTISLLRRQVTDLTRITFKITLEQVEALTEKDLERMGASINPQNSIEVTTVGINAIFENHYHYFITVYELMTGRIRNLLTLYDILDDEILKS